ncbi:hypothetical protein ACLS0R_07540 [Comamonas jiangduensis]|uniref:hypothetical protein n=1 Tax=Comamonas jiangduensis TaxID=1194168 RepID=UPI003BF83858
MHYEIDRLQLRGGVARTTLTLPTLTNDREEMLDKKDVLEAFDGFGDSHVAPMALQHRLRDAGFDVTEVVNVINEVLRDGTLLLSANRFLYRATGIENELSQQWELARHVYAWHRVLYAGLNPQQKAYVVQALGKALTEFEAQGGIATTGTDPLGQKGPILKCTDGREVPYNAGLLLADTKAAEMRQACR